ncbi:MAG: DegT/DnrJ/EryC1/StrS family aminotransferase [Candidatus Aminicenantes bacterium]|nr:DegT/DnrJ/EryC1/StrS family aminotransferase [Candidatus Aminicenantes bacterium]
MRKAFLPFSKPSITKKEIQEVVKTLESGWLTTGKKAKLFEERLAEYIGTKFAVSLSSGTAALFLSLIVNNIQPGDEVITTPLTFISTANVVHHLGARPIFCDIDENTYNIDPNRIEEKISKRTKAVIPVHYSGQPCDMKHIMKIARKHRLSVIEDAAHAMGAEYYGRKVGSLGNLTCFSLFPTKNMTTGEGGFITLNDDKKAQRLIQLRLHGMTKDGWKRYTKEGSWYYEVREAGYKYNLPDINAAIGLVQLKRLNTLNQKRKRLVDAYKKKLSNFPGIRVLNILPEMKSSWHIFPIWVDKDTLGIDRNRLVQELWNRNIGTSVHFIPLHLQPFYQKTYAYKKGDFPVSEKVFDGILSLPLFPDMNLSDIDAVVSALHDSITSNSPQNSPPKMMAS